MPYRLTPPFQIASSESAYWVVDAEGMAFGYCYYRKTPIVGTQDKMTEETARQTARWIARKATEEAKRRSP